MNQDAVRFSQGLDRVASVIEGNNNYDSILGEKRLQRHEYSEIVMAHGRGAIAEAADGLIELIRKTQVTTYVIPEKARIITFANTQNNKREVEFFIKNTGIPSADIVNMKDYKKKARTPIGQQFFSDDFAGAVRCFISDRKMITRSLVHQIVNYAAAYCAISRSFCEGGRGVRGLVIANDHSPIQVALSMVCACHRIKRVYLQHAEVTSIFPPLDFEYAILRNEKSLRTYQEIGEFKGKAKAVSRMETAHEPADIFRAVQTLVNAESVTVGIYPSSVFDIKYLRSVIRRLQVNQNIQRLFIKPHPRTDISEIATEMRVPIEAKVPECAHIAIVGNSSVSLELALNKKLVFQDFKLDTIGDDYYGFVRDGLTSEIRYDRMVGRFWAERKMDEQFLDALTKRLADEYGIGDPWERKHFFKSVAISIGGGLNEGETIEEVIHKYLRFFPRTFFSSMRGRGLRGVNDFTMLKALDTLFNERRLDLAACYQFLDTNQCRSVVDFWFLAKQVEWNGAPFTNESAYPCMHFIQVYAGDRKTLSWLESKIFDLLVRTRDITMLSEFLSSARAFTITAAGINKKIAFIRLIKREPHNAQILVQHYDYRGDRGLSDLERIKIKVQCNEEMNWVSGLNDYRSVEDDFLKYAPSGVVDDYRRFVLPVYQALGSRVKYIDVKRNATQELGLLELISGQLRNRAGFSLVRLSDGEGYLFQRINEIFSIHDAKNRERHWWGEELDQSLRDRVIDAGLETVGNADIVGIPSIYRFVRDCGVNSTTLLSSIQGRGLISVLQGIPGMDRPNVHYADDKINTAMFNKLETIRSLAHEASSIVVVNGARVEVIKETFATLGKVDVITIPTHNKTAHNEKFTTTTRPLPYVFDEFVSVIRETARPGTLVLVGAGIAGKSFVNAAKQAGAVGLDLGSALDELIGAGIHSLH